MTAQPDPAAFKLHSKHLFAAARSDWLDEFSRLEVAVCHCEAIFHPTASNGKLLGQRLSALKALQPSPTRSKLSLKTLRELVVECETLLPLRATIVHSAMQLGRLSDRDVAFFQNSQDSARGLATYLVLKEEDFIQSADALERLAARFEALATAASPPPPKPAAKAGP